MNKRGSTKMGWRTARPSTTTQASFQTVIGRNPCHERLARSGLLQPRATATGDDHLKIEKLQLALGLSAALTASGVNASHYAGRSILLS